MNFVGSNDVINIDVNDIIAIGRVPAELAVFLCIGRVYN